jgi:predicted anti-sigma-YlaC factor YlaD
MDCLECVNRLWEYLDDELEAEVVLALHGHLGRCAGCRPAYECDRAFLALLARASRLAQAATPDLQQAIRRRLALIR